MIKFGTGGWRAIIGDEFTRSNVEKLAQSVAIIIKKRKIESQGIVVGYDRRFLSDTSARWIAAVFAANGIITHLIERHAPTPMIMYTVMKMGCEFGMAVTASHNPAAYNGIKIFVHGGRDASIEDTSEIEDILSTDPKVIRMEYADALSQGLVNVLSSFNDYVDSILEKLDLEAIKKKELRILLDPMYGVAKTSLQTILMTARCRVDAINDRHDTLFGGKLPSPNALTLTRLKNMVVEEKYDMGIGTDGDADRIGLIDDAGRFVHPNEIMMLLYYYLHEIKGWKGDVVRNLATTHILDRMAEDFGSKSHEVPVGFKHISGKMTETDALIGGESSGGLTIRGHINGKDGIFAAALLVEMVSVTGKEISELLDLIYSRYGYAYMSEESFTFTPHLKDSLMETLFDKKLLPEFGYDIEKVSYLDGVKVYFECGGWIIARFSGTEPLIRVFAEMPTKDEADGITNKMKEFLGL